MVLDTGILDAFSRLVSMIKRFEQPSVTNLLKIISEMKIKYPIELSIKNGNDGV